MMKHHDYLFQLASFLHPCQFGIDPAAFMRLFRIYIKFDHTTNQSQISRIADGSGAILCKRIADPYEFGVDPVLCLMQPRS